MALVFAAGWSIPAWLTFGIPLMAVWLWVGAILLDQRRQRQMNRHLSRLELLRRLQRTPFPAPDSKPLRWE